MYGGDLILAKQDYSPIWLATPCPAFQKKVYVLIADMNNDFEFDNLNNKSLFTKLVVGKHDHINKAFDPPARIPLY